METASPTAIASFQLSGATVKNPGVCCCVAVIAIKIELLVGRKIKETRANHLRASRSCFSVT